MSKRYQGGVLGVGFNPLRAPNAPTIGTATVASSSSVSVAFTAPTCVGGSAITSYAARANCGAGGSGASSPVTVGGLCTCSAHTFSVSAINSYGPSVYSAASNSVTLPRQQAYTTPGTYSWVVPVGVTSVSVVAIGGGQAGQNYTGSQRGGSGGELRYLNNTPVTPGSTITVVAGYGGGASLTVGGDSSFGAVLIAKGGGSGTGTGGTGFAGGGSNNSAGSLGPGGGGAGGYAGVGGTGGGQYVGASAGTGGAGGGGNSSGSTSGQGGGGTGILGQGCSGAAGGSNGGSGGTAGGSTFGGVYGGGGGGSGQNSSIPGRAGGDGAVRIIWPGTTRAFPSTNTGNL